MNAMFLLIGGTIVLIAGYIFYGGWLAKQWGIDPKRPTPAQELQDGIDYVPSKPYILLGWGITFLPLPVLDPLTVLFRPQYSDGFRYFYGC